MHPQPRPRAEEMPERANEGVGVSFLTLSATKIAAIVMKGFNFVKRAVV